jgi:hypothetical protein
MRIEPDDGYIVFYAENEREERLLGCAYLRLAEVTSNKLKLEGTIRYDPIPIYHRGKLEMYREGHTECEAQEMAVGVPETPPPKPLDPGPGCYYCLDGCELCMAQVYDEPEPDDYDW